MMHWHKTYKTYLRFYFFWILAGVCEYPFFQILINQEASLFESHPLGSLALHILSVLFLAFSISRKGALFVGLWLQTWMLFGAFIPVFGWMANGFLFIFCRHPHGVIDLTTDEEYFYPTRHLAFVKQHKSRRERVLYDLDFMPLVDILEGDDVGLQRGAIEKLAEIKNKEALETLTKHRSHSSAEVRFYVTSSLDRVKKEFDQELDAAKRQLHQKKYEVSARISLAKTYLKYAHCGLLDETTSKIFEDEALFHFNQSLDSGEVDAPFFKRILDVYLNRGQWDQASVVIANVEEKKRIDSNELLKAKAHIYFRSQKFEEMKEALRRLNPDSKRESDWFTIKSWWGLSS